MLTTHIYSRPLRHSLRLSWNIESIRITHSRCGLAAPRRAEHRSPLAVSITLRHPSVRRSLGASEEHAVVLDAELREFGACRRWVGLEVEAVSGILRRGGRDGDRRRTLEEVTAEFVRRVAESEDPPSHSAPFDFHRVDDGTEDPQRVRGVETVRDRENVE